MKNERGRIRTALRLNQDGNAEIDIKGKVGGSDERLRTSARWQLLDDRTLHPLEHSEHYLENTQAKWPEHDHGGLG